MGAINKKMKKKDIIGLQYHNQSKVNPRWWMKLKIERALSWITQCSEDLKYIINILQEYKQNN